jgi:hypothetical protein
MGGKGEGVGVHCAAMRLRPEFTYKKSTWRLWIKREVLSNME